MSSTRLSFSTLIQPQTVSSQQLLPDLESLPAQYVCKQERERERMSVRSTGSKHSIRADSTASNSCEAKT